MNALLASLSPDPSTPPNPCRGQYGTPFGLPEPTAGRWWFNGSGLAPFDHSVAKDPTALVFRIDEVCPLPANTHRVVALTAQDDVQFEEVAEAIALDPALASEVLRIANSPFFKRSREVDSLEQAVLTIGLAELNCMATAMAMLAAFKSDAETSLGLHEVAVVSGCVARKLGPELGVRPRSAFLCGLLAEIGAMACLAVDGEAYALLYRRSLGDPELRSASELHRYGASTRSIGAQLLERNELPPAVIEAVGAHEEDAELTALGRLTMFSRQAAVALFEAGKSSDLATLAMSLGTSARELALPIREEALTPLCLEAGAQVAAALDNHHRY